MTDAELLALYGGGPKASGEEETGYESGYEASGDDEYEVGIDPETGAVRRRKRLLRPRGAAGPIMKTDRAFGGALKEGGWSLPVMAVGHAEGVFLPAAIFTLTFVSQARTVITGFALTSTVGVLRNVTATAGPGQPIAGFGAFNVNRFQLNGVNNRIPPFILESGITFTLTGTVTTTAVSEFINMDVLGVAVSTALKMATA
jgi:hypothetical protein